MLSFSKNFKTAILALIIICFYVHYQDYLKQKALDYPRHRYDSQQKQSALKPSKELGNLTFVAKLTEHFPENARIAFESERAYLRENGKEGFFKMIKKTLPEYDPAVNYDMK